MSSDPHKVQCKASWQINEDHNVIRDMTTAEMMVDPNTLHEDGIDVLKMMEDLDDMLSSLSKPSMGEDTSGTEADLCNTSSIQYQPSSDTGSDTDSSHSLEQIPPRGAINGTPQEMSFAMVKITNLHEVHPWHPTELVSRPAEQHCIKQPGRTQEGETDGVDSATDAVNDAWSVEVLVGDLDEDKDGALLVATKTAET